MNIIERLIKVGLWGMTNYEEFLPSCRERLFLKGVEPPRDHHEFWRQARCDLEGGRAWGKHPQAYPNSDEGCRGLMGQGIALQLLHQQHSAWEELKNWTYALITDEIVAPMTPAADGTPRTLRGGWAEWTFSVIPEMEYIKDILTKARAYNDAGWLEIQIGLAETIAAYTKHGHHSMVPEVLALFERSLKAANLDEKHNNGLGQYHHPRTFINLGGRDQEPNILNTDATINLAYANLIAFALYEINTYLIQCRTLLRRVKDMKQLDGLWYPYMKQTPTGFWKPMGWDREKFLVSRGVAIWRGEKLGVPATDAVPKMIARIEAGMKELGVS